MIDCIVIDDDPACLEIIIGYVNITPGLNLVFSSTLAQDALPYINKPTKPLIAFLDIEMPMINGLKLAELICLNTAIVFVTGHPEYALESFDRNVFDYLVKPVAYDRFFKAYTKISRSFINYNTALTEDIQKFVFLTDQKYGYQRVLLDQIIYVEMVQNYAKVVTPSKDILVHITLKQLLYQLASSRFIQVHKSYMINTQKILNFGGNKVKMENDADIPIGEVYKQALVMKLYEYTIKAQRG